MRRSDQPSRQQSAALHAAAIKRMPGGVNSPVRAFKGVGGTPVYLVRGAGAWVWDVDGNAYIDYVGAWGPLILGHAHPEVTAAVARRASAGFGFGAPSPEELELAAAITAAMPWVERVRLVTSGTEATMSALRLARAATGRSRVIKFAGCYHGHVDSLLVQAGSGVATLALPDSPGVTAGAAADTSVVAYNDLVATGHALGEGDPVAAVIVEPVAGNMGLVLPEPEFLPGLRDLCTRHGALLVFDEVMTGFRVGPGGAAGRFGVVPDLVTLGKVIGGGLPVGAYGGRADLMAMVAPEGPVYQAGTLAGSPLVVAAGIATLSRLTDPALYDGLEATARQIVDGVLAAASAGGIPMAGSVCGGMFGLAFAPRPIRDFADASAVDGDSHRRWFHGMLDRGVYLAPSAFEAGFVSTAHGPAEVDATLKAATATLAGLGTRAEASAD